MLGHIAHKQTECDKEKERNNKNSGTCRKITKIKTANKSKEENKRNCIAEFAHQSTIRSCNSIALFFEECFVLSTIANFSEQIDKFQSDHPQIQYLVMKLYHRQIFHYNSKERNKEKNDEKLSTISCTH